MKTAKEWFQQLPEPIRTQAIENWEKSDREEKNGLFASLSRSLDRSFWYDKTPQGDRHWEDICYRAESGEFDQPTPNLHGWIPVGERLPTAEDGDEKGKILAVTLKGKKLITVWYIDPDLIKFWQPLPKLPEVQND